MLPQISLTNICSERIDWTNIAAKYPVNTLNKPVGIMIIDAFWLSRYASCITQLIFAHALYRYFCSTLSFSFVSFGYLHFLLCLFYVFKAAKSWWRLNVHWPHCYRKLLERGWTHWRSFHPLFLETGRLQVLVHPINIIHYQYGKLHIKLDQIVTVLVPCKMVHENHCKSSPNLGVHRCASPVPCMTKPS